MSTAELLARLGGRRRAVEVDHGAAIRELELEQAERRSTSARSTRLGTTSVAVSTSSTGCSA